MGFRLIKLNFWSKLSLKSKPKQLVDGFDQQRTKYLIYGFLAVFSIIAFRAVTIQIFSPSSEILETLARRQYQAKIELSPYRGNIYDRRGEPLAISIRRPSIYVNPRIFNPSQQQIRQLANITGIHAEKIRAVTKRKNYFAWLIRKIDLNQATKIKSLDIKGLFEISEPARFYPAGSDLSHLIGYVGLDNRGLLGLELAYDHHLQGDRLATFHNKDARGQSIYRDSLLAMPEKTGKNVVLTIDSAIQNLAQTAIMKGIQKANAKGGFAIVSDPHTGRILAIANASGRSLDSPHRSKLESLRNRAISDIFEPGSVIKPLVIGRALELNLTTIDEIFDTNKGLYKEDSWQIRDSHTSEKMTTEDIIIHSSNIGTYKIVKRLGPERLQQALLDFGITQKTHTIGFPGQMFGRISPWQSWRPIRFANIAFGQGFFSSGLEIVQAFGAIANGGNLMRPYLIDHIESPDGGVIESHSSELIRRVLAPHTSSLLRSVLRKAVESGTGKNAILSNYTSGGKTGTSEKVDPITHAYSENLRIASFVGFAPSIDPNLVIYVVIDEPGNKPYFGGTWAAPVFREIAEEALRYLNVAPDKISVKETLAKNLRDPLQKPAID